MNAIPGTSASTSDTGRVSLTDLAKRLGVHYTTVFRWTKAGVCGVRLQTTRVGGRLSVSDAQLQEFFTALNTPRGALVMEGASG